MQKKTIDTTFNRPFLNGFLIGLLLFLSINLLAAHRLSDCGLPAILGTDSCADDIVRAGFPFIFFEEGGFAFRRIFSLPYLSLDIFIGLALAALCGLIGHWLENR
ncbi:MAG: hypothetical protein Q7J80_02565 [Anaerolineales bacterium]|nr:hypothetical protein [Anaerolineales bacterium]